MLNIKRLVIIGLVSHSAFKILNTVLGIYNVGVPNLALLLPPKGKGILYASELSERVGYFDCCPLHV